MTDLWHSLHLSEFSYLQIVAELWGLPFNASDVRSGVDQLADSLLTSGVLLQAKEILTEQQQEALVWLDQQGGRARWDQFSRKFGQIRQMGAGKMEREKPYLSPISPGEGLWYRALIARGFFETESGPQEFAYLPDDLREIVLPLLNPERIFQAQEEFICRVAAPRERKVLYPASTAALDHICSLLAGMRMDLDPRVHLPDVSQDELDFYYELARSAGLITEQGQVLPENTRQFFELAREEAIRYLWRNWKEETANLELDLVPDFEIDGEPELENLNVRQKILDWLESLPAGDWWSIGSFIAQIKERDPDFLRSGGEYDSWFIKQSDSGEFLSGFQHWDDVEGSLLRYFLVGPLHWLGLLDLGAPDEELQPLAFQKSELYSDFVSGRIPPLEVERDTIVQIRSQGEIRIPQDVPHRIRYQIARFCDWYPLKAEAYQYRISPDSLARAEAQGLRVAHLLSLLENHAEAIPPNISKALQRWESQGSQASIESKLVLRLGTPAVLKSLKKTRAERYILEQLGPTAVIIRPGSQQKVAQALLELGFFSDINDQSASQT
ncbi:MAG: helicase-associated domain-containing protein [Anaerolineales bacterium]